MSWSHAQIAAHRHADLLAEAADRRLAGGNRRAAGKAVSAARTGSWSLLLRRPGAATR